MKTYVTKSLMLILFTLWLGIFGVSLSYALTLSEARKILASDGQPGDRFGDAVSISGDTAVIGARANDPAGSAYVYVRTGSGNWNEQQILRPSTGARFSISVSIDGDTIVIGSTGSAFVFVRDGTGAWREQQKLTVTGGLFGESVSISGDTTVIGAREDGSIASGAAYVFIRDGAGVWNEQQKLTASDGETNDQFGNSVSIDGDTAVIGARGDNDKGGDSGSAYVFVRDGTGVWHEQPKLTASDGDAKDFFGVSVSIDGDTAVIGALGNDDKGDDSGSAYVFVRDGTGVWREQPKLTASDGAPGYRFGESVSIDGDTAVIGARGGGFGTGSAYVFIREGSVWTEQQILTASDREPGDIFGIAVSLSGETAVIGAGGDDDKGTDSGSAYVFDSSESTDVLIIEKLINHRIRKTPATAAQLLTGTRYRVEYKVTNNSPNRLSQVQVFEDGQLVCNLFALEPGESKQPYRCARNEEVLSGINNFPATVTARVSDTNQDLTYETDAYYTGIDNVNMPGKLSVTHYVNNENADTQANAVKLIGNHAEVLFRVENTGRIELYRVNTFHDPLSPINSGWQQQCFFGTLDPGQVRYCKRPISVTEKGLNIAFGHVRGELANVDFTTGSVKTSNPTYFVVSETMGRPIIDGLSDTGIFIWENQRSNWVASVVSGGQNQIIEVDVNSSEPISNVEKVSIEFSDVFTILPNGLDLSLNIRSPWLDGFKFTSQAQADTCVSTANNNVPIYVGPDRVKVGNNINLRTLTSCP